MQFQTIVNSIKRGVTSPIYLLFGEEDYLQEKVISTLREALLTPDLADFNYEELDGEKCLPAQIAEAANTLPVFAEKRLVLVKNPTFLQSGKKEGSAESKDLSDKALLDYCADPLLSTCLIFLVKGNIDKRRKLVKAIEKTGQLLEFKPLRSNELSQWLRDEIESQGLKIESRALAYIVNNSTNELRQLKQELEKLALYCGEEGVITLADVEKLLTKTSEANIFALVDSLGEKKGDQALMEMSYLLDQGEPPVRLLFMIARQYRLIIQAKELSCKGYSEKQISSELKTPFFVTSKLLRQARHYQFAELEKILSLILECDVVLKTQSNNRLALEQLILKII